MVGDEDYPKGMDDSLSRANELFFGDDLSLETATAVLQEAARGRDDADLFFEYHHSEGLNWEDGTLKNVQDETRRGFSVRVISGTRQALAHSSDLRLASLKRAVASVRSLKGGNVTLAASPGHVHVARYEASHPIADYGLVDKVALLQRLEQEAHRKDSAVCGFWASLHSSWQLVLVLRPDGSHYCDIRPLVRLGVRVTVQQGDQRETGVSGTGGRDHWNNWTNKTVTNRLLDNAIGMARLNLDAHAAPAGETQVVLSHGWPGILLHEAVGHGLEGDFNRKGLSAFAHLMGKRIAAKGVTVVDDATITARRGSLTMDDEGTAGQNTTLIEDGILCGFMQDRMNARLMGVAPTGNGRRESYAHCVMPRMTNTYMLAGDHEPQEIIESVKDGIYAVQFGGGQVDITSGQFVFSASLAYRIENGKVTHPIKGATLIGSGATALRHIAMVGNDMALDDGIGTCGKEGQLVPVGVGQPTLRIDNLTVGGTS